MASMLGRFIHQFEAFGRQRSVQAGANPVSHSHRKLLVSWENRNCAVNLIQVLLPCQCNPANPYFRHHEPSRSEEHTSELQSLMRISYAVFCLKTKKNKKRTH